MSIYFVPVLKSKGASETTGKLDCYDKIANRLGGGRLLAWANDPEIFAI